MSWQGEKVKKVVKEKGHTLKGVAKQIGVSRQSVSEWVKGKVPTGSHLVALCKELEVSPDYFFNSDLEESIVMPSYRTRLTAKVTPEMQTDSLELAKDYLSFFRNIKEVEQPVSFFVQDTARTNTLSIAQKLREMSGVESFFPVDELQAFSLMNKLGINVIFREFTRNIKGYAFYTKICGHKAVFVNNMTNMTDLVFPLLHESVHSLLNESDKGRGNEEEAETFCDEVASYTQFTVKYIEYVYNSIYRLKTGAKINQLKELGEYYKHSLHGIVKSIRYLYPAFDLKTGGADTNLKKGIPSVGDILFKSREASDYLNLLKVFSPIFVQNIVNQIDDLSDRKLGELFGLESYSDSKAVREELLKQGKS